MQFRFLTYYLIKCISQPFFNQAVVECTRDSDLKKEKFAIVGNAKVISKVLSLEIR